MTEIDDELRRRVGELETEVGEAVAAQEHAEERALEAEAALLAAYDLLAAIGDPLFVSTFEESRIPEVADLRRRLARVRTRNKRLKKELAQLRKSRAVRWSTAARRALRLDR